MTGWAVLGLGFGDEGKGTLVDFLTRATGARIIVRWNGGPQAAHNVVSGDLHHCFAQFGSGMLVSGTETVLAREMLVDPVALGREAHVLEGKGIENPLARLTIDPRCFLVLPFHKSINQMREIARGNARHGSCGRGAGEAAWDAGHMGSAALTAADLLDGTVLTRKLLFLWQTKVDLAEQLVAESPGIPALDERLDSLECLDIRSLARRLHDLAVTSGIRFEEDAILCRKLVAEEKIVFEGAHGVLLDRTFGFYPHVTRTDTTLSGLFRTLQGCASRVTRIGVLRAYATRHGPGPFPSEDRLLSETLSDVHNLANEWQGPLRAGWLDLVALRYASKVSGGVESLALTCLDRLAGQPRIRVVVAYESHREEDDGGGVPFDFSSRPLFRDFSGFTQDIASCRSPEDLPDAVANLISFLESAEGLGLPVSIVSAGPAAEQKMVLRPEFLNAS